jgi:hypothetical protein
MERMTLTYSGQTVLDGGNYVRNSDAKPEE